MRHMDVVELAPGVSPTRHFIDPPIAIQMVQAGIGVSLQGAGEVQQVPARMLSLALFRIREPDGRGSGLRRGADIAHISPEMTGFGSFRRRSSVLRNAATVRACAFDRQANHLRYPLDSTSTLPVSESTRACHRAAPMRRARFKLWCRHLRLLTLHLLLHSNCLLTSPINNRPIRIASLPQSHALTWLYQDKTKLHILEHPREVPFSLVNR